MFGIKKSVSEKGVKYIQEKYGVTPKPLDDYDVDGDCLFSIYDKVCEEYNPPFICKNLPLAIRTLKDSFKGKTTLMTTHPEDYELVLVGYFDKSTGEITPNLQRDIQGISTLPILSILDDIYSDKDVQKQLKEIKNDDEVQNK